MEEHNGGEYIKIEKILLTHDNVNMHRRIVGSDIGGSASFRHTQKMVGNKWSVTLYGKIYPAYQRVWGGVPR